jgi:acyl-CoA synthetase (AMP-forming)/AMP-acid ligase II
MDMRVIDFFDKGVSLYPNNRAFVEPGGEYTYTQAAAETHHIAAAIRGRGCDKGSKIAVLAPNSNIAFITLLGLLRAEAIWLPINPRNSVEVNIDLLDRFEGELLFYHSVFETEANAIKARIPAIKELVLLDGDSGAGTPLAAWCATYPDHCEVGPEDPDDLMAIFPTGGTTGKSKGVMMSHRAIETFFSSFWTAFTYHDDSHHLVVAPMTHSAGIMGMAHFPRGGTNYIMSTVDPEGILQAVQEYGITHFFIPPTVLYMMLALPNVREYDCSSLQHMIVAAAPTSLEKLKEAVDVFGPVMTECYGQAEAPGAITVKAPWDYLDPAGHIIESRLGSIGRPSTYSMVAMLDEEGNEVPRGEAGEICVKGDLVTPGYYNNPQATAEIRQFGWHHTGDVGVQDEEGFIRIVDRKKDMIITGGFNVYPNEIEQVLSGHPSVQDCAVIGVPDDQWGEAVKAVVQLKPATEATEHELQAMVKAALGGVKAPKTIDFVDDLPRSPAGKVRKTDIRKPYWQGQSRAVN